MKTLYLVFMLGFILLMNFGCSTLMQPFMPAEIKDIESHLEATSNKFMAEHPETSRSYKVGAREIHYIEVSDTVPKPLIIFIHGSPGTWRGWADFLVDPTLRERAHLIAMDRPGYGGSNPGQVERSLAAESAELSTLLDHTPPGQRVILVGHSFGGPVVARMAMDYPNKVTDVVILAGSIDPGQEKTEWYQYPADWWLFSWMIPTDLVVCNREIMALKPELEKMLPLWPRVTQRVSVIQGEADDLVPPENATFAKKMATNSKSLNVILIPKMNHFLPWKQYDLVKTEILAHL